MQAATLKSAVSAMREGKGAKCALAASDTQFTKGNKFCLHSIFNQTFTASNKRYFYCVI